MNETTVLSNGITVRKTEQNMARDFRFIFDLYNVRKWSLKEIGELCNVSHKRIWAILNRKYPWMATRKMYCERCYRRSKGDLKQYKTKAKTFLFCRACHKKVEIALDKNYMQTKTATHDTTQNRSPKD